LFVAIKVLKKHLTSLFVAMFSFKNLLNPLSVAMFSFKKACSLHWFFRGEHSKDAGLSMGISCGLTINFLIKLLTLPSHVNYSAIYSCEWR
jgi:hypothetical protein